MSRDINIDTILELRREIATLKDEKRAILGEMTLQSRNHAEIARMNADLRAALTAKEQETREQRDVISGLQIELVSKKDQAERGTSDYDRLIPILVTKDTEIVQLKTAIESLDTILCAYHGITDLAQARMIVEKALGIYEQRTEDRRRAPYDPT